MLCYVTFLLSVHHLSIVPPCAENTLLFSCPGIIQALQSMQMVVVDIRCGRTHSVALTSNGQLYSWGNNHMGQLGVLAADLGPHSIPRLV